jgi:hypothetical protein
MIDFALFLAVLGICSGTFAILQTLGLRAHRPRRILCYLLGVYVVSATVTVAISAVFLRPFFSSLSCFAVGLGGTLLTCFFAAGLYSFLGPATADRSCTAHFLMLLRQEPDGAYDAERLVRRFDGRVFMEKRFDECLNAGLIQIRDGRVSLTSKGLRMANLYAAQLRGFRLDCRDEFNHSFPECQAHDEVATDETEACAEMHTCSEVGR